MNRTHVRTGGCARKSVSLPSDVVTSLNNFLETADGRGITFSAFVADAILDRLELYSTKKKGR